MNILTKFLMLPLFIFSISVLAEYPLLIDYLPEVITYKPGETIVLPNKPGNYLALQTPTQALWWNENIDWFGYVPVRNYHTVKIKVPKNVAGTFYILEIDDPYKPDFNQEPDNYSVYPDMSNPNNWLEWREVRGFPIRINNCGTLSNC